jgi:hypothetical protein
MKFLLVPVSAALVLGLSACAPATGSGSSVPGASNGPSVAPSSAPASHASSTGAINVCGKIPVATVASLSGRTVYTTGHEIDGPSEGAKLYACEYTDSTDASNALDGFNLVVYRGGDPTKILKGLATALTAGATPLSGIGDKAQSGDGEVDIVVGTDVVVASDSVHEGQLATLSTARLESLARKVMALL